MGESPAAGTLVAFVLPYPIARLLGGFGPGFQFVDREVSPVEAFGILGTMLLPIAAWAYATMRLEQALAASAGHGRPRPARST